MPLIAAAVLLAGCSMLIGDGATPTPPGGGRDPDEPIGGAPADPPGRPKDDGALREAPDPTVVDGRGVAVDHYRIGPDGRTLVVYWWGGTPGCFGLQEVLLERGNGALVVTVIEGTRGEAVGQACTMEAVLKSTAVTLDAPILVDGSGNAHEPGEPPLDLQPAPVQPLPGIVDARPHAVIGYELSGDGRQLTVFYAGGTDDCYGLADVLTERQEGGLPMVVTVREGRLPDPAVGCPDIGVLKAVTIALEDPLVVQAAFDN